MDLTAITSARTTGCRSSVRPHEARKSEKSPRGRADRYACQMSDSELTPWSSTTHAKDGKAVDTCARSSPRCATGRATPALVETLIIDYYGSMVPLRQIAGFNVPDARLLVISPYDKGSLAPSRRPSPHRTSASRRPTTAR